MQNIWTWATIIVIGFTVLKLVNGDDASTTSGYDRAYSQYGSDDSKSIDRQNAIDEYWGEIKENLDGTETINACSSESGNCYDLDADISSGSIDEIHFDNGGYLYFSADIESDGSASDIDEDGNDWDFTLDMDSSIVDDAILQWADDNGYIVQ